MIDFGRMVQSRCVELAPRHLSSGRHVMALTQMSRSHPPACENSVRPATWLDDFGAISEQFQRGELIAANVSLAAALGVFSHAL
eukprot:scaffold273353_cov31-Prasinocladus_malaysianus.AAC.1